MRRNLSMSQQVPLTRQWWICHDLDLGLSSLQSSEKQISTVDKSLSPWYFVTAAQTHYRDWYWEVECCSNKDLKCEGGFGVRWWAEGGGSWRCVLEKPTLLVNEALRAILIRAQKEKRAGEEASIFLENTWVILNRMFTEICRLEAIPMRSLMEIRNMLLESGGKAILVIKRQRTWLNYAQVLVFCRR